jgi:hypothetical protein
MGDVVKIMKRRLENRPRVLCWARKVIGSKNVVKRLSKNVLVDKNGRYWVAVGPNVMNPNHKPSQGITCTEMKYGTKIDVVLKDKKGIKWYLQCVVGDVKAHTYLTGIVQTGYTFPNGKYYVGGTGANEIEFCGCQSSMFGGFSDYSIESIIVAR